MSVKLYSFTVGRDGGWSCVTPNGLITAEKGVQVTIAIAESWEQGAAAIAAYQKQERETVNVTGIANCKEQLRSLKGEDE